MSLEATQRFSSRVENYVKYRPGYPAEVTDFLRGHCGLAAGHVIADVGSGTGKLTELFLKNGNRVLGVEPNREMRGAAERLLKDYPRFKSIDATAEATSLAAGSVDIITAGQAFHWFDREKTRAEFARILKPGGWVVLIWNDRKTEAAPFLVEYENLLVTFGTDYQTVNHKNVDAAMIGSFYGAGGFGRATFPNAQVFDLAGLRGRLLSSSYAPEAGDPRHVPMLAALNELFQKHQADGTVSLDCDTLVYYGQLTK